MLNPIGKGAPALLRGVVGIKHVIHQQPQARGLLRCHRIHIVYRSCFPDAKQFLGRNHAKHNCQIVHQGWETLVHDPAAKLIEQGVDPALGHLNVRVGIRIYIGVGICIGIRDIVGIGDNVYVAININVNINIYINDGKYIYVNINIYINIDIRIHIGVNNGVSVLHNIGIYVRVNINIHINIDIDRIDVFAQLRDRIGGGGLAGKIFIDRGYQLAEVAVEESHAIGYTL